MINLIEYLKEYQPIIYLAGICAGALLLLDGISGRGYSNGGYSGGKRPEGDPIPPKGGSGNSKFYRRKNNG